MSVHTHAFFKQKIALARLPLEFPQIEQNLATQFGSHFMK